MALAVYPGSFDPPTVAHLAVAGAALAHVGEVRFVLSEVALGKEGLRGRTPVDPRRRVLDAVAAGVDPPLAGRLSVVVTRARLIADIAAELDADAVVLGADKWAQVLDPAWYGGSIAARDAAVARLPRVLLAPRAQPWRGTAGPDVTVLDLDPAHRHVSATRARAGEAGLMLPEAHATGLWPPPT